MEQQNRQNGTGKQKWYALYTKARHEKKVAELFDKKGITYYLPLVKTLKQWSDRKKWVQEVLIKSYIFVNTDFTNLQDILQTPGVVQFVKFERKEAAIPDKQILALQKMLSSDVDYEITNNTFKAGQKIKITEGQLTGLEGEIISTSGKTKLYLRINNVGYGLLAEVPANFVKNL